MGSATAGDGAAVADELLASHNDERMAAGLPPMRWDRELAGRAQLWADHLASAGLLQHHVADRTDEPEGENLWAGTRGHFAPDAMVGLWLAEKTYFTNAVFPGVSTDGRWERVGHYSQVMWRRTTHVGCAIAQGRSFDFLVCRYREAGNVYGERPY